MNFVEDLNTAQLLSLQWLMNVSRYAIVVGGSYLFFWRCFKHKFGIKSHNPHPHKFKNIKREILYSLQTLTIFLIPTYLIVEFGKIGIFKIYFDINEMSIAWYVLSYVASFFLHDTYFYWTHRMLHTRPFFKFHSVHHKSLYPTPFAAFAFNFTEGLIQSFSFVFISLIIPLHVSTFMIFTLYSLVHNVYGHLGMDILSKDTMEKFPFKYFNHPTHHGWHHRYARGNYGLYLRLWDKVCGTWKGDLK